MNTISDLLYILLRNIWEFISMEKLAWGSSQSGLSVISLILCTTPKIAENFEEKW